MTPSTSSGPGGDSTPANDDALAATLLQLGHAADSGELDKDGDDISAKLPASARPATEETKGKVEGRGPKVEGQEDDSEVQPEVDPTKAKAPQPGEKPAEEKKDEVKLTDAERAAKEEERKDRSWKALEAEKVAVRAEKEALERQRAEAAKPEVAGKPPRAESLRDERGYTADQYDQAAKDFEAEGDTALAAQARQAAEGLRTKESEAAQQHQQAAHRDTWMKGANDVVAAKEALQDLNSPLAKEVKGLLQSEPLFHAIPDGFKKAVEISELRLTAAEVPSLRAEITKLKNDLQEAQGKLAIGDGSVTRPVKEKSIGDMSLEAQEREIRRLANDFDAENAA